LLTQIKVNQREENTIFVGGLSALSNPRNINLEEKKKKIHNISRENTMGKD